MRRPLLLLLLLGLLLLQQGRCSLEFVIDEETVSKPSWLPGSSSTFQRSKNPPELLTFILCSETLLLAVLPFKPVISSHLFRLPPFVCFKTSRSDSVRLPVITLPVTRFYMWTKRCRLIKSTKLGRGRSKRGFFPPVLLVKLSEI